MYDFLLSTQPQTIKHLSLTYGKYTVNSQQFLFNLPNGHIPISHFVSVISVICAVLANDVHYAFVGQCDAIETNLAMDSCALVRRITDCMIVITCLLVTNELLTESCLDMACIRSKWRIASGSRGRSRQKGMHRHGRTGAGQQNSRRRDVVTNIGQKKIRSS